MIVSHAINPVIAVIGAGSYGTAIAIALAYGGNSVLLWGHKVKHVERLQRNRVNDINLPGIPFPPLLYVEKSLSKTLKMCTNVLIAVPSYSFGSVLTKLRVNLQNNGIRVIIASKGLEPKTGRLLQDVVHSILGDYVPFAVISGPTFARELAIGLPTAITLASTNIKFKNYIKNLLNSIKNIRVYDNTDIIGIQISGATKNIIAIGVGISDGMGFGANARAALITRGLAEISRLGIAIGAKIDVFMGLSGLGDLVLTCTDNQSRNRRFGILLGQGININQAQKNIGQVIEGIYTTKVVRMLSHKYKVIMPITEQVYQILYNNKDIHDAVYDLLNRSYTVETV